jgi:hypothetical protein
MIFMSISGQIQQRKMNYLSYLTLRYANLVKLTWEPLSALCTLPFI